MGWHSRAQTSGIRLSIEVLPIQGARLSWTTDAGGVVLQRANSLTAPLIWNPAPGTPTQQNNRFTISFDTSGAEGYFRLALTGTGQLTRISSTSPTDREADVSVNRETI